MTSKAILTCRQNSHPFQERILTLEQPVKIGRSVARSRSAPNNAIFDCKVLSRNHALFWYNNGKFYLQDTKSSNGTFVNSQRLSKSGEESSPREVYSGDIVQFGVDVLENARKVNHGCIIANIKLFLPDGNEAKSSILPTISSLPPGSHSVEDLYQLNQYIQEAIQREQMLEEKLATLQTALETICKAAEQGWKALIMEDKLLSRVENLESQLEIYSKDFTEDKMREELRKLHEDKEQYQSVAKERLNKALEEKNEALNKYQEIKRSFVGVEEEHANMCIQMLKSHGDIQDLAQKYSAQVAKNELIQIKCQELENDYRETVQKLESRNQELEQQLEKLNINKKDIDSNDDNKPIAPMIELEMNSKNSIDLIIDDEEDESTKDYKYQPHLNDDVQLKLVSQLQEITEKFALSEQSNKSEDEDPCDYDSSESIITCMNDADHEKDLLKMQLEEAQLKTEQHKLMADELSATVQTLKLELDLKNSVWDNRVKDELNSAKLEILRLEKMVSSQLEDIKVLENDKKNYLANEPLKSLDSGEPNKNIINELKNRISELQEMLITVETRYMECHEERTVLNKQLKALQIDHEALVSKRFPSLLVTLTGLILILAFAISFYSPFSSDSTQI